MTTVLGRRSPIEQEHDMPPVHALVVAWPDELPGMGGRTEVVDDDGQIPVFELATTAAVCTAELRAAIPGVDLAVVSVWRGFVAQTLLDADGRDPDDLTAAELDELIARSYLVEARTFGPADALAESRELAGRIVAEWGRRFDRLTGAAR